jgi:hypothetical protein
MRLIEVICSCGKVNTVTDTDWNLYPSNCSSCHKKLPIPKESEEKVVDFGW